MDKSKPKVIYSQILHMKTHADFPQGLREKAFTQGLSTTAKHRGLHTQLRFCLHKEACWRRRPCGGRQNKAGTRCVGSQLTWKKISHCFVSLTLPSMASWSSPSQRHMSVQVLESMALSVLCWTYAANVLAADESFAFCYNKIQALTCVVSYLGLTDGSPSPLLMKLEVKISLLSCSVTVCVWCLCSSAGGAGADTPGCIHSEKQ